MGTIGGSPVPHKSRWRKTWSGWERKVIQSAKECDLVGREMCPSWLAPQYNYILLMGYTYLLHI